MAPDGEVYSLELIPDVARSAAEAIEKMGSAKVKVIQADGGEGYAGGAPYDRAIFTAGTYDLPHSFFEQIREGGLMLAVIKNEGGGDTLCLLRKVDDHFESIDAVPCGFVQKRGKYKIDNLDPIPIEKLPDWPELEQRAGRPRSFWWRGNGRWDFKWRTHGTQAQRVNGVRALALTGDKHTIPLLFKALDDPSTWIEYWANEGLERMGVGMTFFNP